MKHDKPISPDELDALPAQAIASLEHAFRREFARTPSRREHVRIDVVNSRLSKKTQVWIDIVGFAFFLTPLCIVILVLSTPEVIDKFTSGEVSGNPGGLIRWPVWVAIPVGITLLMLQGWSELIKRIAFLAGQGPDPMGKLADKSAEEELAEALRAEAERKQAEALAAAQR